jgi:hypothetical protein
MVQNALWMCSEEVVIGLGSAIGCGWAHRTHLYSAPFPSHTQPLPSKHCITVSLCPVGGLINPTSVLLQPISAASLLPSLLFPPSLHQQHRSFARIASAVAARCGLSSSSPVLSPAASTTTLTASAGNTGPSAPAQERNQGTKNRRTIRCRFFKSVRFSTEPTFSEQSSSYDNSSIASSWLSQCQQSCLASPRRNPWASRYAA